MATTNSKYQIKRSTRHDLTHTDLNSLGHIFNMHPAKVGGQVSRIFSGRDLYSKNPLTGLLLGISGREEEIDSNVYEWGLKGPREIPLVSLEKITTDLKPGLGGKRSFKIKLEGSSAFTVTDRIHPQNVNYQVRVSGVQKLNGGGNIYTVYLVTDKPGAFFPLKYLKEGVKWVKLDSVTGEASDKGGSTAYSTNIAFRGKLTQHRKDMSVTDYANNAIFELALEDKNGKMRKTWMPIAQQRFLEEWHMELERAAWYGKQGVGLMQDNGYAVETSPGVRDQISSSNSITHNGLTAGLLEEFIMDQLYGRILPNAGERNLVAFTGEYGMVAIHDAISADLGRSGIVRRDETFVKSVSSPYHNNALSYGGRFVQYRMTNGATLDVVHLPLYDDRNQHGETDPVTGRPIESQRITFMDFSGQDGDSNIKLISRRGSSSFNIVQGLVGPNGQSKNGEASTTKNSYEMVMQKMCGVYVKDPTLTGELIYKPA